jgi:hypothetical protein
MRSTTAAAVVAAAVVVVAALAAVATARPITSASGVYTLHETPVSGLCDTVNQV